ncbi:MAG TPA: hypothetical protein P5081_20885 [Phycisphaerae bacterium]|nr:hypothetical protein [Phycisphaerae bacterium]HRW55337.1 hypothetical protein [Phycisphaerae bacterium]
MIRTANYAILEEFATPLLTQVPERDLPIDPDYNVNDSSLYKEVFSKYLRPYLETYIADESRRVIKENLQYFLTTKRAPFDAILFDWPDSTLPTPDRGFDYFLWMWESLFPDEDHRLESTDGWQERYDQQAARELFSARRRSE